jgi:hypothetical protein
VEGDQPMARLFLSYASNDRAFVERLAASLGALGHQVWLDRWEITVGEVLPAKIAAGLESTDYMVVVLSPAALQSSWVERELQMAVFDEIGHRRTRVLPILIADCAIPLLLRGKLLADFRVSYEAGLVQLAIALQVVRSTPPVSLLSAVAITDAHLVSPLPAAGTNGYTDGMGYKVPRLFEINVELGLPYIGKVSGVWKPDEAEQRAAWELYIELVTRVSATGLQPSEGMLRETLSSLYAIFVTTRTLLRSYGPAIARPTTEGGLSFGILAVHVLNYVLRPILATWHPLLLDYEHQRDPAISAWEHERQWEKAGELREALEQTRHLLTQYTNLLARVAGVPELVNR